MLKPLYRFMIELTNGKWSSFILKKFARSKLSGYLVPSFAKTYKINLEEMEQSVGNYPTLHDFFIRKLKRGRRPIHHGDFTVISPVDAVIEDIGGIAPNAIIEVKGKDYSIEEMLGSIEKARKYIDGTYIIFYLSPSHYHRIHAPISGKISDQWELGKKSYPVNKWGLKYGVRTLSKNYRSITEIEVSDSRIAMVKVGAMFVNSIALTHENENLNKGNEMAYFTFGSTVVLLFQKDRFSVDSSIKIPYPIKMGEKVGEITPNKDHKIL